MNGNSQDNALPPCPFPGIEPFSYADRKIFFAREKDVRKLVQLAIIYRGVLLYSESGTGKSSLINAGLIPRAIEEELQPERIRIQLQKGEEFIVERISDFAGKKTMRPSIFTDGDSEEKVILSAEEFLRKIEIGSQSAYPLLIFDQFEEWATLLEARGVETPVIECQETILNVITGIINNTTLRAKVLLSLREDYVTKLEPFFSRCPQLPDTYLRLAPLDSSQILRIIRGPYEKYPGVFKPEISEDLARRIQIDLMKRATVEGVHLSEIQIVCRDLFFYGKDGSTTDEYYLKNNGIQGILEQYLERSISSLPEKQKLPAMSLLSRMVTHVGTRNVISQNDILSRVESEEKIDRNLLSDTLVNLEKKTKLVVSELRREVKYYQIVSEFLIDWIRKKARQVKEHRLKETQRELEIQKKNAELNARKAQRMRSIVIGLIVFIAISLVFGLLVILQQNHIVNHMNASLSIIKKDPEQSLKSAIDAVNSTRFPLPAYRIPALNLLHKTISASLVRRTLFAYDSIQNAVAFSPNGDILAGGDGAGVVRFWNPVSGKELGAVYPIYTISKLLFINDSILAIGCNVGSVTLWNVNKLEKVKELSSHFNPITSLAFCPKRNLLVSTSIDCSAKLWDFSNNDTFTLFGHYGRVNGAAFSPDGSQLATAGSDARIKIWNMDTKTEMAEITGNQNEIFCIAFSPDGKLLAAGERGGQILVWDALFGNLVKAIEPFSNSLNSMSFSPDGTQLAVSGYDGAVHIWEVNTWRELTQLTSRHHRAKFFTYDPTGKLIATAGENGIKIWSTNIAEQFLVVQAHNNLPVNCVAYSKDGTYFATAANDSTTALWNLKNSKYPIKRLPGHLVAFSPVDKNLMLTGKDSTILIWDLGNKMKKRVLKGHRGFLTRIVFSHDGKYVVSMSADTTLLIWNSKWNTIGSIHSDEFIPTDVIFSIDDKKIFTTGKTGAVIVWKFNPPNIQKDTAFNAHAENVISIAYSRNSEYLITGGIDKCVTIWNYDGHKYSKKESFCDHTNAVNDIEPSFNGKKFTSVSSDRTIKIYDLESGNRLINFEDCPNKITCVTFSPDDNWLLVGDANGYIRLYSLDTDTIITRIQQRLTSKYTDSLLSVAWNEIGQKNYGKVNSLLKKAKQLDTSLLVQSKTFDNKLKSAKYYNLYWNHLWNNNKDSVIVQDLLDSMVRLDPQIKVDTSTFKHNVLFQKMINLGSTKIVTGEIDSANEFFKKAKLYSSTPNYDPSKITKVLQSRQIFHKTWLESYNKKYLIDELKHAIALDSALYIAVEELGDLYSFNSMYDSAIIAYEKVNQQHPSPLINGKIAYAYLQKKNYEKARTYAERSLKVNSDCDISNLVTGNIAYLLYRNDEALLALSKVSGRHKIWYSNAFNQKGLIFSERLFMYEETYKACRQAINWLPSNPQLLINLVIASLLTDRWEEANQLAEQIKNSNLGPTYKYSKLEMRFVQIAILLYSKKYNESITSIEDFCNYYNNIPDYTPPSGWSWVGVRHRIKEWNMSMDLKNVLYQLIDYMVDPRPQIDSKKMVQNLQQHISADCKLHL